MPFLKSRKFILAVLLVVLVLLLGLAFSVYTGVGQKRIETGSVINLIPTSKPASSAVVQDELKPVDYKIEEVVRGLHVPWSMVFTSADRFLVTERNGAIREVLNGALNPAPLIRLDEVVETGESGLMGITIHPDYSTNKYVYACMTYQGTAGMADKVERFIDNGSSLVRDKIILDSFPAGRFHAGC